MIIITFVHFYFWANFSFNLDGSVVDTIIGLFADFVDVTHRFLSQSGSDMACEDVLSTSKSPAMEIMNLLYWLKILNFVE